MTVTRAPAEFLSFQYHPVPRSEPAKAMPWAPKVVAEPFMPTVRCALPTRAQPGLAKDPDIARTLRDGHDLNLGVYCNVSVAGRVRLGDGREFQPAAGDLSGNAGA